MKQVATVFYVQRDPRISRFLIDIEISSNFQTRLRLYFHAASDRRHDLNSICREEQTR